MHVSYNNTLYIKNICISRRLFENPKGARVRLNLGHIF